MKNLTFKNGDQMPVIGLGTWKSEPGDVYTAVKEALRLGYRHLDCAYIYGNEPEIGQALSESFQEGVIIREDLWVTSKLWNSFHSPSSIPQGLEKSLESLHLDYLDLYHMHWPVAVKEGVFMPQSADELISLEKMPLSETWKGMESLVDSGKCRHIGVSNFSATKLSALIEGARIKPEVNQIEIHPYLQQPEMFELCRKENIYLTAYSPLGSPDRPARIKAEDEPVLMEDPIIKTIAERHATTPALVLLSWIIQRGASVIPKSINPERMKQNLTAVELELTQKDLDEISQLDRKRRYYSGAGWAIEGSPYTLKNLWDE